MTRNQIIVIGIAAVIIGLIALILLGIIPGLQGPSDRPQEISLALWGVEEQSSIQSIIDDYSKIKPAVKIVYTKFPEAEYENQLVGALASGRGPDIFMFKSNWLGKHRDKIVPAPAEQISLSQFQARFPQTAESDFIREGKIFALPLFIDTLALFYNKDIFDAKTIALPPQNWEEFQTAISRTRKLNNLGQIETAGAAIGGSEASVVHAPEILNNLFLQFGVPQTNSLGGFNLGKDGAEALTFYLQFSNPQSRFYSWNDSLNDSLTSFSQGKAAMLLAYNADIKPLKSKNPFLSFGLAGFPQFKNAERPINFGVYWGLAASKQSPYPLNSWDFIINALSNAQTMNNYLKASGRPPALRILIKEYAEDPVLGIFAKQALTARSWPMPEGDETLKSFSQAIKNVISGRLSAHQAIEQIENELNR